MEAVCSVHNKNNNEIKVNIIIINIPATDNINITFKVQGNDGLISKEESQLFDINSDDRFKYIMQSITLSGNDFLHVYVDPDNEVIETNEKNNYILVPLFEKQINAYLNISTGYENIDNKIRDYLKLFVNEEAIQNNADLTLCIGRKCSNFNSLNDFTLNSIFKSQKFGYKNDQLIFEGKNVGGKPYNAIVGGFWKDTDGKNYVMAYGNDIDGDIAAVKKLISARDLFLNKDLLQEDRAKIIDDFDVNGISVADLLRNPSNFPYYTQRNSEQFSRVVERILNNNNFEVAIKTIKTLNTTSYNEPSILRLKNVNSDFSQNYKEVISKGIKPVVMSGGIFSNLVSWEDNGKGFARELANEGYDVWEIEMNGGENTECPTCPDYTYQDQVDYFWPALIAGVMQYSDKDQVDYIGHSNGCRVALSSLNSYSSGKNSVGFAFNSETGEYDILVDLPDKSVDKFFGVACPATLNEDTSLTEATRVNVIPIIGPKIGPFVVSRITKSHTTMSDFTLRAIPILYLRGKLTLGQGLLTISSLFSSDKISRNLLEFYINLSTKKSSTFDISNVNVNSINLFHGKPSDFIVPFEDQDILYDNLTVQNKSKDNLNTFIFPIPRINDHSSIKQSNKFKEIVEEELR